MLLSSRKLHWSKNIGMCFSFSHSSPGQIVGHSSKKSHPRTQTYQIVRIVLFLTCHFQDFSVVAIFNHQERKEKIQYSHLNQLNEKLYTSFHSHTIVKNLVIGSHQQERWKDLGTTSRPCHNRVTSLTKISSVSFSYIVAATLSNLYLLTSCATAK